MLGVLGLLGIAASVLFYNEHIRYPGIAAGLLPTIGTLMLLESGLDNDRAPLHRLVPSRLGIPACGFDSRSGSVELLGGSFEVGGLEPQRRDLFAQRL